ncbi:UNVERIFIED_CONTAM: hypothetical protein ABID98_005179 [Brevibacillus sp. OAP136]
MTNKQMIAVLYQELPSLVGKKMDVLIRDLAENAEPHVASPMERMLEKWEITEDEGHLRLYFNLCQFVAIPILNGPVIFTQENKGTFMVTKDNRGQLEYRVSFCNEP